MNRQLLIGLPAVSRRDARILLLGSMPGARSLADARYYAHPRNAFWSIMSTFTGIDSDAPYRDRLAGLRREGIALWDVVHLCYRSGSLDSAIEKEDLEINDFASLLERCRNIRAVFFNGGAADTLFRRNVLPTQAEMLQGIHLQRLPSTSPANASWSLQRKTETWQQALRPWLTLKRP